MQKLILEIQYNFFLLQKQIKPYSDKYQLEVIVADESL